MELLSGTSPCYHVLLANTECVLCVVLQQRLPAGIAAKSDLQPRCCLLLNSLLFTTLLAFTCIISDINRYGEYEPNKAHKWCMHSRKHTRPEAFYTDVLTNNCTHTFCGCLFTKCNRNHQDYILSWILKLPCQVLRSR